IDDRLFKQFLTRHGPRVDPAELEKLFDGLKKALAKRGRSLADYLKETGKTEADLRDTWATLLRYQKLVDQRATPDVLKADDGVHLVTVTDKKPGTPRPFEKVADEVKDAYAEDLRVQIVAKLRTQVPVTVTIK